MQSIGNLLNDTGQQSLQSGGSLGAMLGQAAKDGFKDSLKQAMTPRSTTVPQFDLGQLMQQPDSGSSQMSQMPSGAIPTGLPNTPDLQKLMMGMIQR